MGRDKLNLIGQTFGGLTVVDQRDSITDAGGKISCGWLCKCKHCGRHVVRPTYRLRRDPANSCGCTEIRGRPHGERRGLILAALKDGKSPNQIAAKFKVTPQYVYQVRKGRRRLRKEDFHE